MEWLKSQLASWKVRVALVGGTLVVATAYGTCSFDPGAVSDAGTTTGTTGTVEVSTTTTTTGTTTTATGTTGETTTTGTTTTTGDTTTTTTDDTTE